MHEGYLQEDFSIVNTSDVLVIYNQTELEKERKLARLFIAKNRDNTTGGKILITQGYHMGQFMLDSVDMPRGGGASKYFKDVNKGVIRNV